MSEASAATHDLPLSHRARSAVDQPIAYLMQQAVANPGLISLAAGLVDYASLPADPVREIIDELLADPAAARAALQYGATPGLAELREAIFQHLARLDGSTPDDYAGSADDVVVTTGSQQLLHLLTEALIDPGDVVLTARPTYFVYTGFLPSFGATVRGVPIDEHGLRLDPLESVLAALEKIGRLRRVKLIYTCSYHQNPTGITLSDERRRGLVELVRRWSDRAGQRIVVIDDAAYRELTYDPPEDGLLPSIRRYDETGEYVALLHTLSKPFSPGLKTGYGLLPRDLVEPVLRAKGGRDFGSNNFVQHVLHRALTGGAFDRHLATLRTVYRNKRDAMLAALDKHLGSMRDRGVAWTTPAGGLYVWLTLPETVDTGRDGPLFRRAIDEGVLFVPGAYCYPSDPAKSAPRHELRLSFGVPDEAQIERGIARLAAAVREVMGHEGAEG